MSGSLVFIWMLAAVLAGTAMSRRDGSLADGALYGADQLVRLLPRLVVALTAAGFIAPLIPGDEVGRWLGTDSGALGIAIAAFAGLLIPSGPVVTFSLAAVLFHAGAGTPQMVAFVTSWSVFALHRITIYEIPMLGWRFLSVRLLSVLPLPLIAGFAAGAVLHAVA